MRQEELKKEMEKVELAKKKLEEEKLKFEEEKRLQEENERERKRQEKERRIKEELEKEKEKIILEKKNLEEKQKLLEEAKKQLEEEKIKHEQEKAEEEKKFELKLKEYKDKEKEIDIKKLKRKSFNGSNSQSHASNTINYNNNKEPSENSSTNKRRTIRDSDLDHEELIINDSINDTLNNNEVKNKNNFITGNNEQINDYKKIYEKEVTNKIKYELEKDLINKEKESYSKRLMSGKKSAKSDQNFTRTQDKKNNKNKLTLLDLENEKDQKLKDIEKLLKGGITNTKLKQLEDKYKYNKEVIDMIYKYKTKKYNIENNTMSFNSNTNYLFQSNNNINNNTNLFDDSNSNSIQILNLNKYNKANRTSNPKIKEYSNLSPFYYISNGNKISNNMWGYNDKVKYKNARSSYNNHFEKTGLSREEIIQNKLKIYKDKVYKPFLDKVEQEKKNEFKRIEILKNISDPKVKENLETKYAIERGKVDFELTKEKERINNAIKEYEENLLQSENINKVNYKSNIFFE